MAKIEHQAHDQVEVSFDEGDASERMQNIDFDEVKRRCYGAEQIAVKDAGMRQPCRLSRAGRRVRWEKMSARCARDACHNRTGAKRPAARVFGDVAIDAIEKDGNGQPCRSYRT